MQDVIKLLSIVERGWFDRSDLMEINVEEITPVLYRIRRVTYADDCRCLVRTWTSKVEYVLIAEK